MDFSLAEAVPILRRTPLVLQSLLSGLPEPWIGNNEGPDTWSPFDIVGHLIHGERTDWIPRLQLILAEGEGRVFEPFDRFAQFEASRGKTLSELLAEFVARRSENLQTLHELALTPAQLELRGRHPEFGPVTIRQLLSTWVTHDLSHLGQIIRVMAHQYSGEAGPWRQYLPLLREP